MSALDGLRYRAAVLWHSLRDRRAYRAELMAEHDFHLELEAMQQRAAGSSDADARRAAAARFGDAGRVRERLVDASGLTAVDAWRQDVRFAARGIRKSPGFTTVIAVTLALGVATLTAILGVVDTVLLRPLPLPRAERLALVWSRSDATPESWLSYPEFVDLRAVPGAFADLAALRDVRYTVSGEGPPEEVAALAVSANLFELLDVAPVVGRAFTPADDGEGAEPVIVLGAGYWRRRFGSAREAVGRLIRLNGTEHRIVGVLLPSFRLLPPSAVFPRQVDVWVPLGATLDARLRVGRDVRMLHVLGRLRDEATVAHAQSGLDAVARRFRQDHPEAYREAGAGLRAVGFQEHLVHGVRPALLVLLVAASLAVLVVCANLAGLTVARHVTRGRELATRLALGASRARLVRQLAVESALQGALGAVLGLALTAAGVRALRAVGPATLPRLDEVGVDWRLVAAAAAVALVATLLFGLLPALHSARTPPGAVLRGAGRGAGGARAAQLRQALVVGQLAVALALVVAMALVGRSFRRLQAVPLGFAPVGVQTARLSLSPARFAGGADRARVLDELTRAVGAAPGVRAAGVVTQLPLSGAYLASSFDVAQGATTRTFGADLRGVTPDYFRAMGIEVVRGRGVLPTDRRDTPPVAVVDETLAERFWPGADPVGQRVRWTRSGEWLEVVGVVRAVTHADVAEPPRETVYRAYAQYATMPTVYLAVRGTLPADAAAALMARELARLAPDHALADVRPMTGRVAESTAAARFHALLLAVFAAVALVLACVGVVGLVAYDVSRREREVGIRAALGARPAQLVWLFGRRALQLIGLGVALGVALALAGARGLGSVLFGVSAADPLVFTLVPVLLVGLVLLATLVPARRAARLDPSRALAAE